MTAKKLKELPIGLQTFESIIQQNKLYVDKTGEIYKLLKPGVRYFLSRPRRFGKSLTCSTLAAIFEDKRELFKGLVIEKLPYKWKKYAIIKFDFSRISCKTPDMLEAGLRSNINRIAKKYKISLFEDLLKERFAELIEAIKEAYDNVAVIVDEYDKPLLDALPDIKLAQKIQMVLRDFYSIFKADDVDAAVDFLFVTGVTKFAKTSIFSAINNLQELTLNEEYAALVGYTDDEVDRYLRGHIQALADKQQQPYDEIRKKIRMWYNGYQFSENRAVTVYNPFSLHRCLTEKNFSNYWFSTGTPTFLIEFVKKNSQIATDIPGLEHDVLAVSDLDAFALEFYYEHYKSIFVQAGYLTIRDTKSEGSIFTLAYPNYEVRKSMTEQIMAHVLHVTKEKFYGFVDELRKALAAHDMNAFCQLMEDFYATIPYVIHSEKWYQNVFYVICKLLGFEIIVEYANQEGRMDAVLKTVGRNIVIEFKRDKTPDAALAQIEDREYWRIFKTVPVATPVTLVGVSCAVVEKKGVGKKKKQSISLRWKIKEVKKL